MIYNCSFCKSSVTALNISTHCRCSVYDDSFGTIL